MNLWTLAVNEIVSNIERFMNMQFKHWVFTKRVLLEAFRWSRSSVPGIPALMKVQSWNIETASRLDSFNVYDGHVTLSLVTSWYTYISPNEMMDKVCRKVRTNVELN